MIELLIAPARSTRCADLDSLSELIESAAQAQRSALDDILDSGVVDEEPYMRTLSEELGMEWLDVIPPPEEPLPLRKLCGPQVALRHRILPVDFEGEEPSQRLVIATYDPFNLAARQAAVQAVDLPIVWRMASRRRVHDGLRRLYGVGADTFEQILEGRDLDFDNLEAQDEASVIDEQEDEEASVVKFVNQIIREALEQRATDIHVEPLADNLRIRYRVDGRLIDVAVPENIKALQSSVVARLKIMSRLDIAERRLPQDGRINLSSEGNAIDVRVATVPTVEGESVSLRLLNQQRFNVDMLSMEQFVRDQIERLLTLSNGIILVTGPTGSGKSTTLYSFLSEINAPETRIVTIEDPVENKLGGVMQIAVKSEIGLTFAAGLRSILRADPDIVMVGEVRDLETAEIAIRASLTGHLVFSTLHTNDALGGISRLIDMGVEPFLLSAAVRAFLAQRLVRRLCSTCKRPREITQEEKIKLGIPLGLPGTPYEAVGCDHCRLTGFSGRLAIFEMVMLTNVMQDMIAHGAGASEIKTQAFKEGYLPMRDYGWHKVLSGETTIEEVISVTSSDLGGRKNDEMAVFVYKALSGGAVTTGELNANDRREALRILDRKGLQPVKLTESATASAKSAPAPKARTKAAAPAKGAAPAKAAKGAPAPRSKDGAKGKETEIPEGPVKLKRGEVVMFTEELSDMLAAGLQLEPALRAMESRQESGNLKVVSAKLRQIVRDGSNFSSALRKVSNSFGPLYCSLAAAGEASGALHTILARQAEYLKTLQELQGRITIALIYPAFLMFSGAIVAVIFVTKLIPQLTTLLEATPGAEMPIGAVILIALSDFLKKWWIVLLLLAAASGVLFKAWKDAERNKPAWDRIKLKLPLYGPVVEQRFFVQFLETMANLVANGLPLLRSLELTRDATQNIHQRTHLDEMIEEVGDGRALSSSMVRAGIFPPLMVDMVTVGEQTGKIDQALRRAAERYDKELNGALQRIMALIMPAVLIVMALLIGTMAYLMITAIFQTISNLNAR